MPSILILFAELFLLIAILALPGFLIAWAMAPGRGAVRIGLGLCLLATAALPFLGCVLQYEAYAWQRPDGTLVSAARIDEEAGAPRDLAKVYLSRSRTKWDEGAFVLRARPDILMRQEWTFRPGRCLDAMRQDPKLRGGWHLVYAVSPEGKDRGDIIEALRKRLSVSHGDDVVIQPAKDNQIEIVVPLLDKAGVQEAKDSLEHDVLLRLSVLVNSSDHAEILKAARAVNAKTREVRDADGEVTGEWLPAHPPVGPDGQPLPKSAFSPEDLRFGVRQIPGRPAAEVEVLVLKSDPDEEVTGAFLKRARCDRFDGEAVIAFSLDYEGGQRLESLTRANTSSHAVNRRLAIVVNDTVYSAPTIQAIISQEGVITGVKDVREAELLAAALNSGPLPAGLSRKPVEEFEVPAEVTADSQQIGRVALVIMFVAGAFFGSLLGLTWLLGGKPKSPRTAEYLQFD